MENNIEEKNKERIDFVRNIYKNNIMNHNSILNFYLKIQREYISGLTTIQQVTEIINEDINNWTKLFNSSIMRDYELEAIITLLKEINPVFERIIEERYNRTELKENNNAEPIELNKIFEIED